MKYPNEFFGSNMLIDLNDNLCQTKEQEIINWDIHDNYATRILVAK